MSVWPRRRRRRKTNPHPPCAAPRRLGHASRHSSPVRFKDLRTLRARGRRQQQARVSHLAAAVNMQHARQYTVSACCRVFEGSNTSATVKVGRTRALLKVGVACGLPTPERPSKSIAISIATHRFGTLMTSAQETLMTSAQDKGLANPPQRSVCSKGSSTAFFRGPLQLSMSGGFSRQAAHNYSPIPRTTSMRAG